MDEWLTLSAEDDRQHSPQLSASHDQIAHTPNTLSDAAAAQPMDVDVTEPTAIMPKRPRAPTGSAPVQESPKRPKTTAGEELISISAPLSLTLSKTATSKCPSANPFRAVVDRDNEMGPVGISRSAVASQKLKAEMKAGTHKINKVRQQTFENECRLSDPAAEFSYGENWRVFHSQCGKWLVMTEAYNLTRFRQHIKGCKKVGSGSKFTTLNSFVVKGPAWQIESKSVEALVPPRMADYPCLGITTSHDQRIPKFITRTGADGGGARSVTKIANELFNKPYSELSERKKSQVDTAQMHEWSFHFDRLRMAIHSSKCKKVVTAPEVDDGHHTCCECLDMYNSDQRLKSALQKPMPQPENFKYLNKQYQGKSTAERYAKTQGLLEIIQDKVCCKPIQQSSLT